MYKFESGKYVLESFFFPNAGDNCIRKIEKLRPLNREDGDPSWNVESTICT